MRVLICLVLSIAYWMCMSYVDEKFYDHGAAGAVIMSISAVVSLAALLYFHI